MLEITVDDADDLDITSSIFGIEAAYPADDELDFDPGLGSVIEFTDNFGVNQGVQFGNYPTGAMRCGLPYFAIDHFQTAFTEIERCYGEALPLRGLSISSHNVKKRRYIGDHIRIGDEHSDIRIDAGCRVIIITGRQVEIAPDASFFAANYKQDLAMNFQSYYAIDNVRPGFLESFGPGDIAFFIEARFDLDNNGYLFAVFGGLL